jgi:hypothetical protein
MLSPPGRWIYDVGLAGSIGGAIMILSRVDRYRSLSAQMGEQRARALIDRLQVVALTDPTTLREMEKFLDRGGTPGPSITDRSTAGQGPDVEDA